MEIRLNKKDKAVVVSVTGRIDALTALEFEKKITELIDAGETCCVIDCGGLDYVSSAGLRSILRAVKKSQAQGRKIVFAALQGSVKEVFEIVEFDTLFPVFASEEAALKQL